MYCPKGGPSPNTTSNVYWGANLTLSEQEPDANKEGVVLFVYCDKYQNLIGGLGFTALYTSVILVVASFIRGMFAGVVEQIPYYQNPKPDNILQICEAIGTLRVRKQYR